MQWWNQTGGKCINKENIISNIHWNLRSTGSVPVPEARPNPWGWWRDQSSHGSWYTTRTANLCRGQSSHPATGFQCPRPGSRATHWCWTIWRISQAIFSLVARSQLTLPIRWALWCLGCWVRFQCQPRKKRLEPLHHNASWECRKSWHRGWLCCRSAVHVPTVWIRKELWAWAGPGQPGTARNRNRPGRWKFQMSKLVKILCSNRINDGMLAAIKRSQNYHLKKKRKKNEKSMDVLLCCLVYVYAAMSTRSQRERGKIFSDFLFDGVEDLRGWSV